MILTTTRPTPSSTRFPYTTLFRSQDAASRGDPRLPRHHRVGGAGRALDRKSTRLNSSHLGISYAVFCLKNKNSTENVTVSAVQLTVMLYVVTNLCDEPRLLGHAVD